MKEVRIRGTINASTIDRPDPFVRVTTKTGSEAIWPPRDHVRITKRHPYSRWLECEITAELLQETEDTLIVKIKSEKGDAQLEIPAADLVMQD